MYRGNGGDKRPVCWDEVHHGLDSGGSSNASVRPLFPLSSQPHVSPPSTNFELSHLHITASHPI
jgi:hypothetical protein